MISFKILFLIYFIKFFHFVISKNLSQRIIYGNTAHVGQFPHQVILYNSDGFPGCSGVLIKDSYILTAGHCIEEFKPAIIAACELNILFQSPSRQTRLVQRTCLHPQYFHKNGYVYDFALIKVDRPFNLTSSCYPLPLAQRSSMAGTRCIASGWGATENSKLSAQLKYTQIKIASANDCNHPDFNTKVMYCTGEDGSNACKGDSGGPLTCNGKVQAITSWGNPICGASKYVIYAKIPAVHQWIMNFVNSEHCVDGAYLMNNVKGHDIKFFFIIVLLYHTTTLI